MHQEGLGERVRAARKAQGWTIGELAERVGLSRPYMTQIEGGKRQPTVDVLQRIASCLEVPVSVLLGEANDDTLGASGVEVVRGDSHLAGWIRSVAPMEYGEEWVRPLWTSPRGYHAASRLRGRSAWRTSVGVEWVAATTASGRIQVEFKDGPTHELGPGDTLRFSGERTYRHASLGEGWVVGVVLVALSPTAPARTTSRMVELPVG